MASEADEIDSLQRDDTKSVDPDKDEDEQGEDEEGKDALELTEDAEALKRELDKIVVHPPTIEELTAQEFDPAEFPASYKDNLPKENLVLQYAENFRLQYVHLYRDRKPLLLNPINECGTEKFVCTTIRPTQIEFKEFYSWEGSSEFVADYLNFETLEPPFELPKRLISPPSVLKRQKGNCFEYSTLLCSLLVGAGYDAYVVSGYATHETCLADESREICPLMKKREEKKEEEKKKEIKKYTVKPPRDLRSKFELKQAAKEKAEKESEEEKRRKEEEDKIAELEKPPPDLLYGLRIHSWVLVLSGKREVPESLFIEPFTGLSHPVDSPSYLGIESVWNDVNYWVNMQDCSEGVKGLSYDLGDCTKWEYMFPSIDKPLKIPGEDGFEDFEDEERAQTEMSYRVASTINSVTRETTRLTEDEDEDEENSPTKLEHLDMPPSWVDVIKLSLKDFQMRCPHGKKVKIYKRAKLEKFAHYLMKDGLISKLSMYENRELTDLVTVKEYFAHRVDKLLQRVNNHRTGWVVEHFDPGRSKCVKEHHYRSSAPAPENERTMIFYNEARVDGLIKRVETPTEMTEEYTDRDDFLFYKHVDFGKRPKKFGPQDGSTSKNERPIIKMIQKFHRNVSKPAGEDIAELVYLVSEDKLQITYHTEDPRIASSTREYIKPPNWSEKGATLTFSSDMHQSFQVDLASRQSKQVELYQMLLDLLKAEDLCRGRVRESEDEVKEILNERTKEETTLDLDISVYDTERNEKTKKHRRELEALFNVRSSIPDGSPYYDIIDNSGYPLEQLQREEKNRKQDMEIDYLAPFIARIVQGDTITREEAYTLKTEALKDLKDRLINKANLIQARYEKETQMLTEKQAWYHQNQLSCNKEDEEKYMTFCQETLFKIHMLELRLARHKETAPHKYMALDRRLKDDQRLAEYF